MYGEELSRQLALVTAVVPQMLLIRRTIFQFMLHRKGRRRFQEALIRGLKIAVVNGKLLFTGSEEIVQNVESVMPM